MHMKPGRHTKVPSWCFDHLLANDRVDLIFSFRSSLGPGEAAGIRVEAMQMVRVVAQDRVILLNKGRSHLQQSNNQQRAYGNDGCKVVTFLTSLKSRKDILLVKEARKFQRATTKEGSHRIL